MGKQPSGRWRITLAGEDLGVFDEHQFTLNDAFTLEATAGLTVLEMLRGAVQNRAQAMRALVWFMRFKQGNPPHITAIDFNVADLNIEEVVDPTPARSKRNATSISDSSPTTAI